MKIIDKKYNATKKLYNFLKINKVIHNNGIVTHDEDFYITFKKLLDNKNVSLYDDEFNNLFNSAIETDDPRLVHIMLDNPKVIVDKYSIYRIINRSSIEMLKLVLSKSNFQWEYEYFNEYLYSMIRLNRLDMFDLFINHPKIKMIIKNNPNNVRVLDYCISYIKNDFFKKYLSQLDISILNKEPENHENYFLRRSVESNNVELCEFLISQPDIKQTRIFNVFKYSITSHEDEIFDLLLKFIKKFPSHSGYATYDAIISSNIYAFEKILNLIDWNIIDIRTKRLEEINSSILNYMMSDNIDNQSKIKMKLIIGKHHDYLIKLSNNVVDFIKPNYNPKTLIKEI